MAQHERDARAYIVRINANEPGTRVVVDENVAEAGSALGHGLRSLLAKADAMALTCSFQNYTVGVAVSDEVVAGHSVPAETAIDIQPESLSRFGKINTSSVRLCEMTDPMRWMAKAVIADCGEIRIAVTRQPHFLRSASASATAASKHCCDGMVTRATRPTPRSQPAAWDALLSGDGGSRRN